MQFVTARRWQRIQTLFVQALERPVDERHRFLKQICGDEPTVFGELEAMLAVDESAGELAVEQHLLAEPGEDEATEPSRSWIGRRIGPYRLQRLLGSGGMSDVYLAERDDPHYRQQVAVKLIRPGLGHPELVARFLTERQILAGLIHPNIATLLDGGVADDGTPYLVMHYVEGTPLTELCERRRLSIEQRLELFRQVCDAVQFAHQNLIVHRDLKPGNILVTDDGRVKLLDFGIAKLLDDGDREAPLSAAVAAPVTRPYHRLMTPEYAAPEQVLGKTITTATDVYALGLLLYELVTGRRAQSLSGRTPLEIEQVICEQRPKRPSAVYGITADTRGSADGGDGGGDPRPPLKRSLRGDLDRIVMKALRKSPQRRYVSADALSDDLERFLGGRPILARPDSTTYRLGKFVRRHRLGVTVAISVVLLVLTAGITTATQAARIARHAQDLEQERDRVQREVEKTARVKTLVTDLFKAVDPKAAGDPAGHLQAAGRRMIESLHGQDVLQTELMDEMVTIYINLGLYDAAFEMAERSLAARKATFGDADPAVARGLVRLGETLYLNSRFEAAEQQYRVAVGELRRHWASRPTDTAGAAHLAHALVRLSSLCRVKKAYREAESTALEALTLYRGIYGDRHRATIEADYYLTYARSFLRPGDAADADLRRVLGIQQEVLGAEHPDVAWTLVTLGAAATRRGRFEQAESDLRQALAIHRVRYDDDHPDITRTLVMIGRLHDARGELDQAESIYRRVLQARRHRLGPDHTATVKAQMLVGRVLTRKGAYAEAETLLLDALSTERRRSGPDHRGAKRSQRALLELYEAWRPERSAVPSRASAEDSSSKDVGGIAK